MKIKINIVAMFIVLFFIFNSSYIFAQQIIFENYRPILDDKNKIYLSEWDYKNITGESIKGKYPSIIYEIDIKDGIKKIFYEKQYIYHFKLSPDNKLIAVMHEKSLEAKSIEVVIIDKQKKEETALFDDKVLAYKWSPDSKKIIFITGEYISNDHSYYKIEGIWVYDIEKRKKVKIADKAYNVEWFQENFIYLINTWSPAEMYQEIFSKTSIYNYQTGKIEQKDMNALRFSLDGKYYMGLSSEMIGYNFINDEDRKKVLIDVCEFKSKNCLPKEKIVNTFESPEYILWDDIMWVANNRIIVPRYAPVQKSISIYDFRNDMFLKREYGTLVGTNYKRDKLVMYNLDKKFIIVNVP